MQCTKRIGNGLGWERCRAIGVQVDCLWVRCADGTVNGSGSSIDASVIGIIVGSLILALALIGIAVGLIYMRCRLRVRPRCTYYIPAVP
jgi:hypothetical protein